MIRDSTDRQMAELAAFRLACRAFSRFLASCAFFSRFLASCDFRSLDKLAHPFSVDATDQRRPVQYLRHFLLTIQRNQTAVCGVHKLL